MARGRIAKRKQDVRRDKDKNGQTRLKEERNNIQTVVVFRGQEWRERGDFKYRKVRKRGNEDGKMDWSVEVA